MKNKSGSALIAAIWTLAVLSILIASYAMDAHLQTRVNLYLRERVNVDHLTDAGIAIAEVILLDYQNVSLQSSDESSVSRESNLEERLEKDRWYCEKCDLKSSNEANTGAVPVDALNPEGGTVTVRIKPIEAKWNINNLYPQGDANYDKIWEGILTAAGFPEEYWDSIVNSWCDWRDTDEAKTGDNGAETEFYTEAHEEDPLRYPAAKARNGEIADLDELKMLRGFNEFDNQPVNPDIILDGGILNPEDKKEDQIVVTGLRKYFTVYGSGKINVNVADTNVLATVPGIYSSYDQAPDFDVIDGIMEARGNPSATTAGRFASGTLDDDEVGLFKDWNDLQTRLNGEMQEEAQQYLSYAPETYFEVTIIGKSMGITHKITAVAIVQDKKVRYIRWSENP